MADQTTPLLVGSPGTKGIKEVRQSVRTRRFSGIIPVPYSAPLTPENFVPPALAFFHSPFSIIQFDFDIICEGEALIPHPYTVIKTQRSESEEGKGLDIKIFLIHDEVTISSMGYALSGGAGVKIPIQRVIGTYHYLCIDNDNPLPGSGDKLIQAIAPNAVITLAQANNTEDSISSMNQVLINTGDWIKFSHHTRYFVGSLQLGKDNKAGIMDVTGDEYPNDEEYGVKRYKDVLKEMLQSGGVV
jgi:hypothetical protein